MSMSYPPQNLRICHLTWQKGFGRNDYVKDLEMWAQCHYPGPYKQRREVGESERFGERNLYPLRLALKTEKETTNLPMWAASRS